MDDRWRDGLNTVVGFGVLAVQRAAVERRSMQRRLRPVADRVDAVVDPVLDQVISRLPGPPARALGQARHLGRAARRVLLGP